MDENKKEKKPFNVVLLGNIESEKAALLHKYIKKRFAIKQLQEMNNSEENGEEHSNIDEVMNSVEIHGETVKMKIWDNVSANKLFSSSNKSLKVAQGIILFYSVSNRKSFNMLKLSLSKIIDFDKYDIPMVMVGNDSDTQNREVSYEEAKALADSYGLRFYETSIKSGMGNIFEDIGEQVFYQEYGNKNNSNNNSSKNRVLSTSKSTKNFNNNISLYSSEDLYQNNFNNKLKERRARNVSVFNFNREKEKIKADNKKTINKLLNCDIDLDESITSFKNNNNNIKARNKNNILIKSPDVLINSSILNSSSSLVFSYQGNTEAQKKREQEIKERRLKREKEMKTWWKKREKENLENQKIKKQKEKEELQKRIKVDKINQKEEERKVNEENYIKIKNNYEQKKKNNKDIEREIIIGKENKRKEKLLEKRNNKEKLSKLKEEKEKEKEKDIKILYNNRNQNKNKKNLTYNKSESNIYRNKNDVNNNNNKLRGRNIKKNKNEKHLENSESDILNTSILTTEEQEIIKQNFETKNLLLENYQKNSNIYRCLKCKLIPNIVINEYNQEIETFCDESFNDKSHHNITSYSNFQELSLNHPIDNNNVTCYYCSKVVNELSQGHLLYYCPICDIYFCTEDEELHKNQRHKDEENTKIKYLQLSKNKQKTNNKKETANPSTQNKKNKNLTKQNSTPLLLKKTNNNDSKNKGNIKKLKKENKNNDNSSINNSDINITERKEKKKNKIFNKIQIYLIDSYCGRHNEIYKAYCFDCHQNICELCENIHIEHNTVKFGEIMLENEELIEKKNELNKAKEELTKINDYFSALIEAIKCKYERLFSIKKKELEIKEKIIKDYETIKYNFHCINNIRNLKFDNNKNYKDKSNNTDWFHRFNLIFKYLNSNLNNKDNDLFDILNNRNEKSNIKAISNNNDINISKLIVLKNDDICVSTKSGNVIIYNKDNLEEKLNIKIFGNNLEINDIIEKNDGGVLCCGYEYIKNIQLSLNNQSYSIIKDSNIYSEYKNINSIIELNNNLLISSNDNSEIQLWKKENINENYKCVDCYNNNIDDEKTDKNYLYKIKNNSFIYNSFKNNNLTLFKINNYDKIQLKTNLENIRIIKGNNPMVKIPNEDYLLLSCYDYNDNEDIEINNNEYNNIFINYKGEFSIIIIDLNNLNIIGNIKNNYPIIDMMYYYDNITVALDAHGEIHKIEFDKYQQKLFLIDKINFNNNIRFDSDKILGFNLTKNRKNVILYLYNKIITMSNYG